MAILCLGGVTYCQCCVTFSVLAVVVDLLLCCEAEIVRQGC